MTSPAGAGEGAFVVRGDRVEAIGASLPAPGGVLPVARAAGGEAPAHAPLSYDALRRAVLAEVGR